MLKVRFVTALILAIPKPIGNFMICSDVSKSGLGCVLQQDRNVISYASRQLKSYEHNCPTNNLELADIKELNMRQRRWLEKLNGYDISIKYHPVEANKVVGALSRKSYSSLPALISTPEQDSDGF
ncbi:unnamed protein product [Rhodiola kirilowii]